MNKVDFKVAGKMYNYDVPEKWEELTQEQFIIFAGSAIKSASIENDMVRRLLNLDDAVSVSLSISDWWWLTDQLSWMADLESYTVGMMDTIELPDGTTLYGFSDNFSDVTWEEWIYADGNANAGKWDVLVAVLYRPQKADWDHQSDPREEFSQWGAEGRLEQIRKLNPDIIAAASLNYKLMRQQLTRRYRRLFSAAEESGRRSSADLQTLIREVMGDNFYEEEKYLKLSVPSVLYQLDRMVREERERRRRERAS
jgi:hypothetical protein